VETENLLKSLKENNVEFVIIGATAFPVHGYARATLDIDIFIKQTKENANNTYRALKEFGYDLSDITVEDLIEKKVLIRQYLVETDIHPFVKGASFEEVWKHKIEGEIGDVKVFFASLDDLIKMKKAANREKDKEDLKVLNKLKDLRADQ
jgi:predicted nucleotidyltransferase